MNRYVTARRGSEEFNKLIQGQFSETTRALPIQSLRTGTKDEEVTFELVPLDQVPTMSSLQVLESFARLSRLLLVLFPIFYFIFRDWNKPFLSSAEVGLILLGLLTCLVAIQIKVDMADFVSGYDRIRGEKGQKVFSSGARSVTELQKLFQILASVAFLSGILPLVLEPFRILAFVAAIILLFVGYNKGVMLKNRLVRDLCLALIAGPCLAYGVVPQVSSLGFGVVWAFFVFFQLQLEHFQHYFAQIQASEKNLLTMQSFEQASKTLWMVWGSCVIVYVIFRGLQSQWALWLGSVLILVLMSFSWRKQLFSLISPAGSEIEKVSEKGRQLFLTFMTLWAAEQIFSVFVAPLMFLWFK